MSEKNSYYYNEIITDIEKRELSNIKVYPNPATDYINIEISDSSRPALIELYNISVKCIMKYETANSTPISVSHLDRGMYILNITHDGTVINTKLLLK